MFQGGPKITNLSGDLYSLDWGPGTPLKIVGSRDVGRSFMPCAEGDAPFGVYRRNSVKPWVAPSYVKIPRGEIDALYSCSSSSWDNTAPGNAPCVRGDDGLPSTNWKKWC